MAERAPGHYGHYTVAQKFIEGRHMNVSDGLAFLDRQGELDEFLVVRER